MPVRIYTPVEADSYGLLVYFHGGAFFLGSLETHDSVARSLAKETGLQGRLRRATAGRPRRRSRPACEDCYGVGPVGGGATATACSGTAGPSRSPATARAAPSSPPSPRWPTTTGSTASRTRCSSTPSLDLDFDVDRYASLRENAEGYGLETAGLAPFNAFYLDSGADPADPLVSPIKRADLAGLPPALIITAEHDPLRDEGELYGRRLREAGVDATVSRYAGAGHGFVQHFSWIPEYHRAFEETAALPERALSAMVAIHPLVSPWGRFGLYSFFLDAPEPAIVDTGIASSPAEGMAPALEALGRRIEDVRWILLTHGHIDHVGGAHALWELTGRRAQVVISEADAPLLRSRRAHVQQYLDVRAAVPARPRGRGEADGDGGRPPSPGRWSRPCSSAAARRCPSAGTSPSRCTPSRATRPGPSRTSSTARTTCSSATPSQVHGAANGFPGYEDPRAYRASLEHLRDVVRPRHLYLGHPYRTADGVPYGVELDREQAQEALQESLDIEARVADAAARYLRTGCRRPTRPTPRSPASPRSSATPATPRSNRPRSSRRCTATARSCTTMADIRRLDAGGQTIAVRKDLRVPMRDGVTLAADVYSGVEDKPRPALVALSPYGKELQALALTMPPQRRPSPMWDGCIEAGDIARVVGRGLRPRHRRPARLRRLRGRAHRQLQRRRRAARPGRLRRHRVGRRAAVVRRQRRHDRHLLLRVDAGPRRRRAPAVT